MMTENKNAVENIMTWLDETMFTTAGKIGPWLMPIPSGMILGWTFALNMTGAWGSDVAQIAGVCAVFGVVALGAYASHNAIRLGGGWWSLVVGHVVLVIVSLLLLEAETNVRLLGTTLELMTALSYIAQSGARSYELRKREQAEVDRIDRERSDRLQREQADHERAIEVEKLRLAHAAKLARIAQSSVYQTVYQDTPADSQGDNSTRLKDEILHTLEQNERLNITRLSKQYGYTRKTIYRRLDELQAAGLIHKNGNGWEYGAAQNGS